ncbi:MAG: WxL domain-containing protein [Carnobacterium sp.]
MKTTKLVMVSMLATGALFSTSLSVYADNSPKDVTEKSINSQGDVTFKIDDGKTPPVDPTDPNNPVDPIEPGESTDGPLSIDHVSNLHFGEQLISAKPKTYYANLEKVKLGEDEKEVPNYVQVTDKRGSNEGWYLSVKQEKQFATGEDVELDGAVLSLSNTQVKTTTDNKATPPTPNTTFSLTPDGTAVPVMSAQKDEGMGLWVGSFGNETTGENSVSLYVPGESAKQTATYSTTLTWTISNTEI